MTDLTKYVRTPTPATADVRTFLNLELAKIQAATDTFFNMLGVLNMLAGFTEGEFLGTVFGGTTVGAAAYTGQRCRYTKIGRLVVVIGAIQWSGHTGTGNMFLGGLPFPIDPLMSGMPFYVIGVGGIPNTDVGVSSSANTAISIQTAGGAGFQAMVAAGDIRFAGAYYSNT
jgi:hypothetical protein